MASLQLLDADGEESSLRHLGKGLEMMNVLKENQHRQTRNRLEQLLQKKQVPGTLVGDLLAKRRIGER